MSGRAERPLLLAHRGDHRAHPENRVAALRAAMAVPGVDGVEFDVRTTRDGEPVLAHDTTLERTFGVRRSVRDLTAREVRALGVDHLADALAALPASAFLDIELKEMPTPATLAAIRAARGASLEHGVVSAFEAAALVDVRRALPACRRWLNARQLDRRVIAAALELGCAGVAVRWQALTAARVEAARAVGLAVAAWTITDAAARARVAALPLVAICAEGDALDGLAAR